MIRGKKPKPSALHAIEGTRNRRKNSEPIAGGIPTCPGHLDAKAKTEWRRVSKELLSMGLLASVDRAFLAAYCAAWSRWVEAEAQIAKFGAVIKSPKTGDPIRNPYISIANHAMDTMRKYGTEFGLSPASRTRLSSEGTTQSVDPFDEFMQGLVNAPSDDDSDLKYSEED